MKNGERPAYVAIARKAFESNPFWLERRVFSRWEAWQDLLQIAAWRPHRWTVPGGPILTLGRGETRPLSRSYLAARWRWSQHKVSDFLALLKTEQQIGTGQETGQGHTYLIVNYERYQGGGTDHGTGHGTERGRAGGGAGAGQGRKEKHSKQEKQVSNTDTPPPPDLNLGPFLDVWKGAFDAYPVDRGLLGQLLKPLASNGGHDKTLARWKSFVAGIKTRPAYFGKERDQFKRFAGTPAVYDDPLWYMNERDKPNLDGLFG